MSIPFRFCFDNVLFVSHLYFVSFFIVSDSITWFARVRYGTTYEMSGACLVAKHISMPRSSEQYLLAPWSVSNPIAVFIGESIALHLRGVPHSVSLEFIAESVEDVGSVIFAKELPPVGDCRFGAILLIIFGQQSVSCVYCWLFLSFLLYSLFVSIYLCIFLSRLLISVLISMELFKITSGTTFVFATKVLSSRSSRSCSMRRVF